MSLGTTNNNIIEDYLESLLRPGAQNDKGVQTLEPIDPSYDKPLTKSIDRTADASGSKSKSVPLGAVTHAQVTQKVLEGDRKNELQAILSRPILSRSLVEPSHSIEPPVSNSKITVPRKLSSGSVSIEKQQIKAEQIQPVQIEEPDPPVETRPSRLNPPLPWLDNGRPCWGQEPFHALLFKVAGLTLAVPLVALGQIHNITDKLTPIFGQADWFMGLQETSSGRIQTINTALYVMPERYNSGFVQSAKYVISIDGLKWGLAVDEVHQPTELNPDDITWRTKRSSRPWLAGTVKTEMCALLDIPQMGYQLEMTQVTNA